MAKGTLWVIFHPKTLLADYQRRGMDICELVGANDRLVRENTRLKESNRALRKVDKSKRRLRQELGEYRRPPSLPDVMEDGYVVMEWEDGNRLHVVRVDDDPFMVGGYLLKSDCCGEVSLPCAMREYLRLPVLAETDYHVQDGKIVRRDG